ncbi:MAG TPA: site-specific integrase [Ilumatobacteraceae bacterium]|nr:site-specific integrase [Ilumatobacteraceae bacterium]
MNRPRALSSSQAELPIVEAWLASQSSANTRSAYRTDLAAFSRWCAHNASVPLEADAETVAAFQLAREVAGDSAATLRRRRSSLSSFYRFAINRDLTDLNPVAGSERPPRMTVDQIATPLLTTRAVDHYLAIAEALDPRLDALVSLLVFDGLKLGEALALNVDDIAGRPPKVSLMVRRKGIARRLILGSESARAVRRCGGKRGTEPLFTSGRPAAAASPPRRLTRFGADHLIRQLSGSDAERVTSNAFRRFYLSTNAQLRNDDD